MDNVRLLGVADHHYFKHLIPLVGSARKHHPDLPIHLHLINAGDQETRQLVNQKNLTYSQEEVEFEGDEQRKAYCANIRAREMCRMLDESPQAVMYFDADNLIRKNLSHDLNQMRQYDLGIFQRHFGKDIKSRVNTGTIFINNTSGGKTFAAEWWKEVEAHLYEWFADQIGWARAYETIGDEVTLLNFGERFNDARLHAGARVWAGKWSNGKILDRFALEENFYRNAFHGNEQPGDLTRVRLNQLGLTMKFIFSKDFIQQGRKSIKLRWNRLINAGSSSSD